ncbi:MAG: filamentous hemagglutinin N-terminal domain-containing protein [Verrucomicrobiota bacterium]
MKPEYTSRFSAALSVLIALPAGTALANPGGMTVISGSGNAVSSGAQLDVAVGQSTILNWSSFNIQSGETTTFLQPSANSVVLNTISGVAPSQIWGHLNANGTVILANANGFYFGPNSVVNVGGNFVATTAPLPPDPGSGAAWSFTGMPPLASIVNYGQITAGPGHSLFLIAQQIENHGLLAAPGGSVSLAAGQEVLVSERPDGRGLSASVTLPSGAINNSGQIIADAGTIALNARVVNQDGLLQANSVRNQNGVIELVASENLHLGADSRISARGDDSTSPGGSVALKSGNVFSDHPGSSIVTVGGARGGNGGDVEVSAPNIESLNSAMDARALSGWSGGSFLLDPVNIVLGTSGSGAPDANGTVAWSDGAGTLNLNVNTAFANKNFSEILLQASGDISLAVNTVWNLSTSTGESGGHLDLQAGGNIIFGNGSQITDANAWSVNLRAGYDFASGNVLPGVGNIYLNGGSGRTLNGSIQTGSGSIDLAAGQSILTGTGFIRTTGGGSITANALSGDINAGTANGGYQFSIFGYSVSPNLGGISTAAGGDVTLQAGNNVISIPTVPVNQPPGASGAYGSQPGNVTVIAGNQVLGNYTVANGTGTLLAGVQVANGNVTGITNPNGDIGSAQRPVGLGLINGSWNLWAARDVYIAEVRNPNGTFNPNPLPVPSGQYAGNEDNSTVPTRSPFLFNYAPDAAVNVWAGNGITLAGANLPRVTGQNQSMPPVYAPILRLNAGAGGINVLNSIVLFPSAQGQLQIVTRDGGNLTGIAQSGNLTGITMSDSSLPAWNTFVQGHALNPVHLNDPNPVTVAVSGGINSFNLVVPTYAQIAVAGNTYNFGFVGRNLSPSQTTSIQVAGDITYRGNLTSINISEPLPPVLLNPSLSSQPDIVAHLRYDPATGTLTFIGQMSSTQLAFLLNPSELVIGPDGQPVIDDAGNPVTVPVALNSTQSAAIQQLYTASQSASLGDHGLALAGPGQFNITARNIDLGVSGGINVLAPDAALAGISPYGALLNIATSGSLDMTSTRIANESLGGGIILTVGGELNVGGQFTTFGDPNAPKGIFTTSGGGVSVTAGGDVNVNGSRIAAYDGGNIGITSLHGDINAGSGGSGYVSMNAIELAADGSLVHIPASIPGSGILATTVPGGNAALGNITINAPEGSVNASLGGILQIAFNGTDTRNNTIDVTAGHDIVATGSGIIGSNVKLDAGGDITGVVVGSRSVDIGSAQNVDVTAFSGGNVDITASGDVSGTVIGGGSINVSGDSISASLVSSSVTASGDTSGAAIGVPTAGISKDEVKVAETEDVAAPEGSPAAQEDLKKQLNKPIALAQKTGRVTVVLPSRN